MAALAADDEDLAEARATLSRIDAGEGTMLGEVVALMMNHGLTPVAAWRPHRGRTQSDLARRAGLSQLWVNRSAGEGAWYARDAAQAGGGVGGAGVGVGGWGTIIVCLYFREKNYPPSRPIRKIYSPRLQ